MGMPIRKTPIPQVPIFGDNTPYENPLSLTAYRCSQLSLLPGLGWPFGLVGCVLGVIAYRRYKKNPDIEGRSQSAAAFYVGAISFILQSLGIYCIARGQGWLG
jgi:hypothetical protein